MKILIFGLPGSGKTYLAQALKDIFGDRAEWFNADIVRTKHDNWDFSLKGRGRQNKRMCDLANEAVQAGKITISDFICPLETQRQTFDADLEIFMDTIKEGRFADTNRLFQRPDYDMYDCIIPHYTVKKMRNDVDAKIITAQIEEMIKST